MKKVLVFGMTENPGGVESVIMNYYRHFDRNNIKLDFLCNTEDVAYEDEIINMGGKIYKITARSKNYKKYKHEINTFFKNHAKEYNAIWVNICSLANIDYLKYAKKYNIKKRIIHCHNSQNMDSFLRGLLHRFNKLSLKKYATDFWTCSNEASSWFYSDKIINSDKYLLINNAIDCNKYAYNKKIREKIRKDLNLEDKIVFGNIGRLHFQKNQEFALKVFSEYLKINRNAVFLLVGDGEDKEKLKNICTQYNISDKVKFLGIRNDIPELLQAMDIFLFPSLFEGFALSLIEAQASGIMIFTSTNVKEEIKMSDSIYFMDLVNEEKWAKEIAKKYNNYNREKNKIYIKEKGFDIEENAKKIEKLF